MTWLKGQRRTPGPPIATPPGGGADTAQAVTGVASRWLQERSEVQSEGARALVSGRAEKGAGM